MASKPHYLNEVISLGAKLGKGAHDIDVYHDSWCAIWRGGACNCQPEVKARKKRATPARPRRRNR